ncbi:hypothetical protein [uncultured Desulfobacter sp.]|uniref:hypothetical protein n=1 Tax=uncultured Desulfobacter sp. TaxID=240139 RepID=UPI002AAC325C|nr:hypothetical protein [uncultured Desulfobacter sp.]
MTSVPQINSPGMHNRAALSDTSTASSSRELYVNSYSSLDAGLTIQTREGDVVTLFSNQYSELEGYEYSRQGVVSNQDGFAAASYNVREITLSTGETFSFTVEGDLSEEEIEDVKSIITGVDGIIGEMMQGDLQEAVSQAMQMGYYDSISSYEADITVQYGYAMHSEEQTSATGALGRDLAAAYLGEGDGTGMDDGGNTRAVGDLETSLVDQLTGLLEKQREDSLARAREPLGNLFDYYLRTQEDRDTQEASDAAGTQGNGEESLTDESKADDKEISFSDLLELAAKAVDRTIADMVKNAFENTLKFVI